MRPSWSGRTEPPGARRPRRAAESLKGEDRKTAPDARLDGVMVMGGTGSCVPLDSRDLRGYLIRCAVLLACLEKIRCLRVSDLREPVGLCGLNTGTSNYSFYTG
jgi:hypothetical protein